MKTKTIARVGFDVAVPEDTSDEACAEILEQVKPLIERVEITVRAFQLAQIIGEAVAKAGIEVPNDETEAPITVRGNNTIN